MDDAQASLEGIAAELHDETGCEAPVDAFDLAFACGLDIRPGRMGGASRRGDVIYVDLRTRPVRQHGLVAHELGHWALERAGEDDSEPAARYLSGALMLPRRAFDRDLRETRWHFDELRARHLNASAEMVARRIVELRDAVATVIDEGQVRRRVTSSWLRDPRFRRVTSWERELADRALTSSTTVHGDELCYAVPILDGSWRRVIVVCEARQLSLRL